MPTQTDICNLALDVLKEAPIGSIDDDRPIGRWLKRNFDVRRDALLEKAEWNFALKRAKLPADSEAPAFGWDRQFTLPPDCIRVIPLTVDGTSEGVPIPHEIENGKILCNMEAPLKVRYVFRCVDYGRYPGTFQLALAAQLAMGMAHWLTGKSNFASIAENMFKDAMSDAWLSDAVQGTTPRPADDDWVNAR